MESEPRASIYRLAYSDGRAKKSPVELLLRPKMALVAPCLYGTRKHVTPNTSHGVSLLIRVQLLFKPFKARRSITSTTVTHNALPAPKFCHLLSGAPRVFPKSFTVFLLVDDRYFNGPICIIADKCVLSPSLAYRGCCSVKGTVSTHRAAYVRQLIARTRHRGWVGQT